MGNDYPDEQLLKPAEAARLLGLSERTLHRMVVRGEIVSIKRGRLRRYRMRDIRDWQDRHRYTTGGDYDP